MKVRVYFCKEPDIQVIVKGNKFGRQALDTLYDLVWECEFKNILNVGMIWLHLTEGGDAASTLALGDRVLSGLQGPHSHRRLFPRGRQRHGRRASQAHFLGLAAPRKAQNPFPRPRLCDHQVEVVAVCVLARFRGRHLACRQSAGHRQSLPRSPIRSPNLARFGANVGFHWRTCVERSSLLYGLFAIICGRLRTPAIVSWADSLSAILTICSFNMFGCPFGFMVGSAASGTAGHALRVGLRKRSGHLASALKNGFQAACRRGVARSPASSTPVVCVAVAASARSPDRVSHGRKTRPISHPPLAPPFNMAAVTTSSLARRASACVRPLSEKMLDMITSGHCKG